MPFYNDILIINDANNNVYDRKLNNFWEINIP